jgi:hypothetical protein
MQTVALGQQPAMESQEKMVEIVVIGRQPGPPLWKITDGEHVLWILPLINLYPRKIEWESDRVEQLIAGSQEYIAPPYSAHIATISPNPINLLRILSVRDEFTRLQEGKRLADVLPADLYQRFSRLKERHFPRDRKIEKLTPREAGKRIQQEILNHENLEMLDYRNLNSPLPIMKKIHRALDRNKAIRRTTTSHLVVETLSVKSLRDMAKESNTAENIASRMESEVACLKAKIAYFESDLESAKKRANAWAQGDVDDLIVHTAILNDESALQNNRGACLNPGSSDDALAMDEISHTQWLAAADTALTSNERTFAVLGINEILGPNSLVDRLQEKGYFVEISSK